MTSRYRIIDACKLLLIKFAACRQREWSVLFIEVCFTLTVGTSLIIVLLFLCRSRDVTDIPAVPKSRSSSTRKNVGIAFSVVFAVVLVVFLAIIFHKRSRRQVFSFPFNTKIMKSVYVTVLHKELITPDPGGVLPYITYTGMCRPTGSWFWSSWFRTGYPFQGRFLERGIIFWTHESSSTPDDYKKLAHF